MKLTVLGSGSVCPNPRRASTGYLLEAAGLTLWLDMGHGTVRRYVESGRTAGDVDRILITHLHPDHTSDLVPYLFACNYAPGWISRPVHLLGPEGFEAFLDGLAALWMWTGPNKYERSVQELARSEVAWPGLKVSSFPVLHKEMKALAYRIEAEGKVFCFSGDTGPCEGVLEAARGADLFLCECAIPEGFPPMPDTHMTSQDVGRVAAEAGVKRLVVTHLYPKADEVDLLAQVAKYYRGPMEKAEDLLTYEV